MSYQEYLAKFREAGQENEIIYQHYMHLLLEYLSPIEMIEIGTKYILMFLPRFEKYYSDVKWTRAILEAVSKGQNPDQSMIDDMYGEIWDRSFDKPGCQYFVDAVERLSYAFKHRDKLEAVINSVRMALEAIIFGMNFELWATEHPEDYELFYDVSVNPEKYSLEEQHQISRKYTRNTNAKAHETRLVLSIADDIEEMLRQKM